MSDNLVELQQDLRISKPLQNRNSHLRLLYSAYRPASPALALAPARAPHHSHPLRLMEKMKMKLFNYSMHLWNSRCVSNPTIFLNDFELDFLLDIFNDWKSRDSRFVALRRTGALICFVRFAITVENLKMFVILM